MVKAKWVRKIQVGYGDGSGEEKMCRGATRKPAVSMFLAGENAAIGVDVKRWGANGSINRPGDIRGRQ